MPGEMDPSDLDIDERSLAGDATASIQLAGTIASGMDSRIAGGSREEDVLEPAESSHSHQDEAGGELVATSTRHRCAVISYSQPGAFERDIFTQFAHGKWHPDAADAAVAVGSSRVAGEAVDFGRDGEFMRREAAMCWAFREPEEEVTSRTRPNLIDTSI